MRISLERVCVNNSQVTVSSPVLDGDRGNLADFGKKLSTDYDCALYVRGK